MAIEAAIRRSDKLENESTIDDLILTTSEAADLLNVHTNTLRRWSDRKIIYAERTGSRRDRKFRKKDLYNLLTPNGAPYFFTKEEAVEYLGGDTEKLDQLKDAIMTRESADGKTEYNYYDLFFLKVAMGYTPKLLKVKKTAEEWNTHENTIRRSSDRGPGDEDLYPCFRVGPRVTEKLVHTGEGKVVSIGDRRIEEYIVKKMLESRQSYQNQG